MNEQQMPLHARLTARLHQLLWEINAKTTNIQIVRQTNDGLSILRALEAAVDAESREHLRLLRVAWEAGFRLCRGYGDNHAHFDGDQKERQWRAFLDDAQVGIGEEHATEVQP